MTTEKLCDELQVIGELKRVQARVQDNEDALLD